MIYKLASVIIVAFLTGCVSQIPVTRTVKNILEPDLNVVKTQELGNTLIQFYTATTMPSIEITQRWSTRKGVSDMPPQILAPLSRSDTVSKYWVPISSPNASILFRNVCFDVRDSSIFNVSGYDTCDLGIKAISNSGPISVQPAEYVDVSQPYFKQELIYNGRINNNLKFMYREL